MRRFAVLLLLGCGGSTTQTPGPGADPRDAFVGSWLGEVNDIYGQTGEADVIEIWTIAPSDLSSDRVAWSTAACDFQAKVTSRTTFEMDPANCRPQTSDSSCTSTDHVTNGTGTLSGTSLNISIGGSVLGQCPGLGPLNGTIAFMFYGEPRP